MSRYGPFGNRGARRHLVTLQAPTVVAEAGNAGGYTTTWADLSPARVWAAVTAGGGGEAVAGHVERASITHVVEMDYHAQLTHKCRVVLGTRHLYVLALENVGELNATHIVTAEERA